MKKHQLLIALLFIGLVGCGPEAIVLRSGLDTPSQHVANGNHFLKTGKIQAAVREFDRALELDPGYVAAYVGLALVKGQQGDIQDALATMDKADRLAKTDAETRMVDDGFCELYRLQRRQKAIPESP